MVEEPLPRLSTAPLRLAGQEVGECRQVRQAAVDVEHHHPLAAAHLPDPSHMARRDPGATPTAADSAGPTRGR
ncbi:hypothetical protein [Rhodococcus sp. IEGM 1307]|uniref:hypothetical protein n=1 Tax=Rhodococcus sp. IEGM 1307 TaxID=3047091 RepID=UPI0024B851AF|nr:hypothetical protein [Rhodococcus sp. IEGM 1307]MDI9977319.1 hypothetical protein [Rhodococcus sp. IEGM 1307]